VEDFNKRYVRALGWPIDEKDYVTLPREGLLDHFYFDEKFIYHVDNCDFNNSYDWAYLLLYKCRDEDKLLKVWELLMTSNLTFSTEKQKDRLASPQQISEASLIILEQS